MVLSKCNDDSCLTFQLISLALCFTRKVSFHILMYASRYQESKASIQSSSYRPLTELNQLIFGTENVDSTNNFYCSTHNLWYHFQQGRAVFLTFNDFSILSTSAPRLSMIFSPWFNMKLSNSSTVFRF